jgi:acetyl-CoA C-acetyltransferase
MRSVVICEPVRTPVGRFGGVLSRLTAAELATTTLRSLVQRTRLEEGSVDDVVLGHCYPSGEAPAIGRIAALDAGLGVGVPGVQIDRRCGSGLQAVLYAAMQVSTGSARLTPWGCDEACAVTGYSSWTDWRAPG